MILFFLFKVLLATFYYIFRSFYFPLVLHGCEFPHFLALRVILFSFVRSGPSGGSAFVPLFLSHLARW